jgi:hypothetical protein
MIMKPTYWTRVTVAAALVPLALMPLLSQGLRSLIRAKAIEPPAAPDEELPDPWEHDDVGSGSPVTGHASETSGTFTAQGAGSDYGTTDTGLHYIYQSVTGDKSITAYVGGCTIADPPGGGEQCGVMIRADLTATSANAACFIQTNAPQYRIFQYRATDGASTGDAGTFSTAQWVRLTNEAGTISCWYSSDGVTWIQNGADQSITLGSPYDIGMFANSNFTDTLATGTFSYVTVGPPPDEGVGDEDWPYFNGANPFFWDNDSELDVFSLAFALAAVSNGDLNLIGMSRSPNPFAPSTEDGEFVELVQAAIDSGWNIDPALLDSIATDLSTDYMRALTKPMSAVIEDTTPIDRGPAQLMRDKVLAIGTHDLPVVIGAGGPLTTVASAYLLAVADGMGAEFIDRAVVVANNFYHPQYPELRDYNSQQDEWAAYIVMERLRLVIVPLSDVLSDPQGEELWDYLTATPANPMGDFIRHVQDDTWPMSYTHVQVYGDLGPILTVLHSSSGTFFSTITKVDMVRDGMGAPVWGAWPMGYPDHGAGMLNTDALENILTIEEDATSDDRYLADFDSDFIVSTFIATFDQAFAVPDEGDSGGYRPTFTGFGYDALGGRGTGSSSNICHVNSLSDTSGAPAQIAPLSGGGHTYLGTFRQCALGISEPRYVVFDVCGTIQLTGPIIFDVPYMTVAGQTACGQGITFKMYVGGNSSELWYINTHDIVFQHVRIRAGANVPGDIPGGEDSIRMGGVTSPTGTADRIVFDHVSMSWATHLMAWGDLASASNMAFYDSMFYEGLNTNAFANQTMALLFYQSSVCSVTIQRSIFAHNDIRNPLAGNGCKISFFNNIVYDYGNNGQTDGQYAAHMWGSYATCDNADPCADPTGPNVGPFEAVWVGNTYLWGPSTGIDARPVKQKFGEKAFPSYALTPSRVWLDDNADFNQDRVTPEWFTDGTQTGQWNAVEVCSGSACGGGYVNGVSTNAAVDDTGCTLAGGYGIRETNPACISWYTSSNFSILSRTAAYTYDLLHAGAFPQNRDYHDDRIANPSTGEIANGTGAQISNPSQGQASKANLTYTGSDGYPNLTTTSSPYSNPGTPWAAGTCGNRADSSPRLEIECDLETKAQAVE